MMSARTERKQAGAAVTDMASPGGCQTAAPPVRAAGRVPDFALALERCGSGAAVLALTGEIDLYRAPEIEVALAEATGHEPYGDRRTLASNGRASDGGQLRGDEVHHLTVDLRSVTFIDSTMVALLLAASRRQQARGAELSVLVGSQTPMTAFEVTGVDRLLAISRDEDGQYGPRRDLPDLARARVGRERSTEP
jgi:anti-anti-sigma regulatory factor